MTDIIGIFKPKKWESFPHFLQAESWYENKEQPLESTKLLVNTLQNSHKGQDFLYSSHVKLSHQNQHPRAQHHNIKIFNQFVIFCIDTYFASLFFLAIFSLYFYTISFCVVSQNVCTICNIVFIGTSPVLIKFWHSTICKLRTVGIELAPYWASLN